MSAQRLSATAHGVQIEICASETSAPDCVRARLPGGSRKTAHATGVAEYAFWKHPTEDFYALSLNGTWLVSPAPLDSVSEFFEPFLIMRIAERAAMHTFVHTGVVSFCGHAIMLPGYSFAGKTTLVAEVVRAVALYYSDEYAVLDRDRFAHPYPRPL